MSSENPVGKTKTQGWEIGVRRTLPANAAQVWTALVEPPGLALWLGKGVEAPFAKGMTYTTSDGTRGEVRSYTEGSLIRMTWQPKGWEASSTLQIRVQPAKTGTTLSFHHEKLADGGQREAMRAHWEGVIETLAAAL